VDSFGYLIPKFGPWWTAARGDRLSVHLEISCPSAGSALSAYLEFGGSGAHSVIRVRRRRSAPEQDARAEQVDVRASVHLTLEHLDPVDVALHGARAPGQGEARLDRIPVLT